MASPTVGNVQTGFVTTLQSSHTLTYPTGLSSGDTIVICFGHKDTTGGAVSATGFTHLHQVVQTAGAGAVIDVLYRKSDGTESGTFTLTTTNTTRAGWCVFAVTGAADPTTTAPEASTGTKLTNSVNPDSDSLTPTGGSKDYLWISTFASSHGRIISSSPTNYTHASGSGGSDSGSTSHASGCFAARQLTGSVEDPGAFTSTGTGVEEWAAMTVAVYPGAASPQTVGPMGLLDQSAVTFSPTTIKKAYDVTPGLIDQSATVFTPSQVSQQVQIGLIDQSAATFAPTVFAPQFVGPVALIDQSAVLFAPTVTQQVQGGFLDYSGTAFSLAGIHQQVLVGFIDQSAVLFAPTTITKAYDVTPGLIDQSSVTFAPTDIVVGSSSQTIGPMDLLDQSGTTFAPEVDQQVVVGLIDYAASVFSPQSLQHLVEPGLIDQSAATFTPVIIGGAAPAPSAQDYYDMRRRRRFGELEE